MIELNLLPPQEKKLLNLEQIQRWMLFYGGNILLIVLAFIAVLCFVWFSILIQLKSYSQSLQDVAASFQGQDVDHQKQLSINFNQYLDKLDRVQQNHKYYSRAMAEISNLVPAGVRIEILQVNEKDQAVLSGFSPTRTQVLLLQDALAKSRFFTDLNNPLDNLTKPANINFNFKFTIKPDKLVK